MEKKYTHLLSDDGQVVTELDKGQSYAILNQGDIVIRRDLVNRKKETVEIKNNFVKVNDLALYSLFTSHKDLYPLTTLFYCTSYQTGILTYTNGKRIKSISGIARVCGISRSTANRFIKKAKALDIIHESSYLDKKQSLVFTMNPYICCRGSRVEKDLYIEFKESNWRWVNSQEGSYKEIKND